MAGYAPVAVTGWIKGLNQFNQKSGGIMDDISVQIEQLGELVCKLDRQEEISKADYLELRGCMCMALNNLLDQNIELTSERMDLKASNKLLGNMAAALAKSEISLQHGVSSGTA